MDSKGGIYLGKLLRQLFPNQTKSPLHIVIWSLVYILDAMIVFWVADAVGIHLLQMGLHQSLLMLIVGVYLLLALGLFSLQATLYNKIFR